MVFSKLPPVSGYPFSSSEKKGNLKHSYSLQDLSTYRQLDLEEGHAFHPHLLQKENGVPGFSKDKTSSRRNKCVRFICILVGLLLITCFSFALQFLYSGWFKGASRYYVVLDCGSTGTRVYVYEASINRKIKDVNLPVLLKSLPESFETKPSSQNGRAYNRRETEPGFDKLVGNIFGLREAIEPLIQWAKKQIPKNSYKDTSLFLYATAGARRLPGSDSEWLLNNAWLILSNSPFSCKREWVKIITGVEEAYYGWIALNYHAGVLGSLPKRETYGALDLGGSSLQVTFEGKNDKTSLNLSIGRVNHRLIAYSLSGYGLNDAFDKSVAYLIEKLRNPSLESGEVEIRHPCLQSGYKEQYVCRHCSNAHSRISVRLIGFPNWEECSALAKIAVNSSEWSDRDNNSPGINCELSPCALSENTPRPVGQFYAMSGFYVVYRFFNLTSDAGLDDVLEKGREFCEMSWDVARKNVIPQPFIEQYCFRAPYVVLLLREGLHITDSRVVVDSGSVTWTLGVALFEAGKAFWNGGVYDDVLWAKMSSLHVVFFAFMFVVVCGLCCVGKGWVTRLFGGPCLQIWGRNSVTSTSVLNIPARFRFQRWSRPIDIGEGRVKTPLSPTIAGTQQSPFEAGFGFSGGNHFAETSLYSSSSSVAHSYSSDSLGQMPLESSNIGPFWSPNRGQMHLQSRRSQSREDLNSSIAEAHLVKV